MLACEEGTRRNPKGTEHCHKAWSASITTRTNKSVFDFPFTRVRSGALFILVVKFYLNCLMKFRFAHADCSPVFGFKMVMSPDSRTVDGVSTASRVFLLL